VKSNNPWNNPKNNPEEGGKLSQEVTQARRDDSDDTVRFPGLAGGSRPDGSVDTLLLPRTGPPAAAALHKASRDVPFWFMTVMDGSTKS